VKRPPISGVRTMTVFSLAFCLMYGSGNLLKEAKTALFEKIFTVQ
jgi:hypothetical protein